MSIFMSKAICILALALGTGTSGLREHSGSIEGNQSAASSGASATVTGLSGEHLSAAIWAAQVGVSNLNYGYANAIPAVNLSWERLAQAMDH